MSPSQTKATFRMVAASFVAGVGAMALVGLVAPVAVQGGLSVREAVAAEAQRPEIAPLDVEAIQAQLAQAQAEMDASRARTDAAMARLERLSGR